jgi:type IV secretion/conjugal transfer VirB4 family ATPase
MLRVATALREHDQAAPVASRIPLWGFIDDEIFLTKGGAVGVGFRMRGADPECFDPQDRRTLTRRVEQAFRQLDEHLRVHQYLLKRPAAPIPASDHPSRIVRDALKKRADYLASRADRLFESELYTVLLYEGSVSRPSPLARARALLRQPRTSLSSRRAEDLLDDQLTADCLQLRHQAEAFRTHLSDLFAPEPLSKDSLFRFFRRLLNGPTTQEDAPLTTDIHLDHLVMDASIECHRTHLVVGEDLVKALTMTDPPAHTFAGVLDELWNVPASLTACLEWRRLPHASMRRNIQARRRHFFNRRVALVNYLQSNTRPDEMLVDPSAGATVDELGHALTDIEVGGHVFGECSLTLLLAHRDRRQLDGAVAACTKAMAAHDGRLHHETYNAVNAFFAVIPGNAAVNVRRLALLESNAADLSPVYAPECSSRASAHLAGREYLAVFESSQHTPYFWNLHHHDVGHALVQGATGSGKSFLMNFLLMHAQKYDPVTVILDLGGSYDRLTNHLQGSRWRMGLSNRDVAINPFALDPTGENLHFLQTFVRVLLESGNAAALTSAEHRDLYEAVESLYVLDPPQRRLATLSHTLPHALGERLERWIDPGPYGDWFDHAEDTFTMPAFGCVDFEGLDQYPAILEPLLFYILHRTSVLVRDNAALHRLTLCIVDEAWRFVRDPTVKAYIIEALKTWRKRNAAMLLVTQSGEDFGDRDLLRTVIESCPTKFFLANPNADQARLGELFHLNQAEAAAVRSLIPRRQLLLKRPGVAKVLTLVDPFTDRLFSGATA